MERGSFHISVEHCQSKQTHAPAFPSKYHHFNQLTVKTPCRNRLEWQIKSSEMRKLWSNMRVRLCVAANIFSCPPTFCYPSTQTFNKCSTMYSIRAVHISRTVTAAAAIVCCCCDWCIRGDHMCSNSPISSHRRLFIAYFLLLTYK